MGHLNETLKTLMLCILLLLFYAEVPPGRGFSFTCPVSPGLHPWDGLCLQVYSGQQGPTHYALMLFEGESGPKLPCNLGSRARLTSIGWVTKEYYLTHKGYAPR